MSNVIESIERAQLRKVPRFKAGDTVRVHFQVIEGQRRRVQVYEGIVLKRQGSGSRETFTVRKQSFGVGVERTFPLHSPKIEKIDVTAIGDVNRAKLYYLRGRVGKKARIREKRYGHGSTAELVGQAEVEAVEAPPESEAPESEAPESEAPESEAPESEAVEADAVEAEAGEAESGAEPLEDEASEAPEVEAEAASAETASTRTGE